MLGGLCLATLAVSCVPAVSDPDDPPADALPPMPEDCTAEADHPKRQLRGAWAPSVRNLDWPSSDDLSAEEQQAELRDLLDATDDMGLNAVFLQVRPTADALYASDLEPWARYLSGTQGGDPGYDPLEFAIEEAHSRGLELHAWFNPYRVGWQDDDLDHLIDDHPAVRNEDWMITRNDEGYLDPGNPDVRDWVGDVVLDVVDRYDVDGVHFDDYFYPYPGEGGEFDDDASWEAHGDDFDSRGAWRRDNVNQLLADIHTRIDETKPWVQFGVSPFGVWRNDSDDSDGSDTRALQSYDDIYADTRAWIDNEWVDYVIPQLYWERGFDAADYEELVPWWSDLVEGSDVDLYIGQAAYRVGEDGWDDEALARQLDFNQDYPLVGGDVYYALSSLLGDASGAVEELDAGHYSRPALPPEVGSGDPPPAIAELSATETDEGADVEWDTPQDARFFAVYRLRDDPENLCAIDDGSALIDVIGAPAEGETQTFHDADAEPGDRYHVTVLDDYRRESGPGSGADIG